MFIVAGKNPYLLHKTSMTMFLHFLLCTILFFHKNKTFYFSVILPILSKGAASYLHFVFKMPLIGLAINRPSLHNNCRVHDMLTLVYKYFYGLAPSYINELLIETNSS